MKISHPFRLIVVAGLFVLVSGCQEDALELDLYGSLQGTILDEETFLPIPGATITMVPATEIVFSNEEGLFFIDSILVESYTVRAKKEGYREALQTVTIEDGRVKKLTLLMTLAPEDNTAPGTPKNPVPSDGASGQPTSATLSWTVANSDAQDTLHYDVYLYSDDKPLGEQVLSASRDTFVALEGLDFGANYYWQVVADDGNFDPVYGPAWQFSTQAFPDFRYHYVRTEDNGQWAIYTGDPNGSLVEYPLSQGLGNAWRPRLSPDREKVAFIAFDGIETHLYTMNRDGSEVQKITGNVPIKGYDNAELGFCWSPNGGQLLYMNYDKLYKINADGSGLSLFAEAPAGRVFAEVDWAMVQNQVVVRTRGANYYDDELQLISSTGQLTELLGDSLGAFGSPSFSLGGNKVLYTYDVSGSQNSNGRLLDVDIFILNLQTDITANLSAEKPPGTNDISPRFSATGGKIVFVNVPNDGVGPPAIYEMDQDGSNRQLLFEGAFMVDMR
ncbi:MAG: carboxypeptidase regulatory-like domain-containing protein [Phaeodactylibacter sp.]|nr:carboxypeptidase regulatory-like domain-containing protein [Phaeodactylibacter sp.]